jgi:CoA:oxalate CoA-transferase
MKPLEGVTVIDLSHAVAGPTCTYQLALLGADVIKIERPTTGDVLRNYSEHAGSLGMSAPFMTINAGKRSVVLDLKTAEGVDTLKQLVAGADVLIENFRPGVTASLGIGFESLREHNPDLIFCSISGFGQSGELSQWAAYDHIVQAMSGLMSVNGHPDDEPVKLGVPIADTFTGFLAGFAILAALLQKMNGQRGGQYIDVSMLDATLNLLNQDIVTYLMTGDAPRRRGNQGFRLVPTSDTFPTATDYIAIGANEQKQYERLCEAIGAPHLATDHRFATHAARTANASALRHEIIEVFKDIPASKIEASLSALQIPVSIVRSVPQIVDHPHVQSRGLLEKTTAPGVDGPVMVVGAGYRFLTDGPMVTGSVPGLGEHTDAVLSGLEVSRPDPLPDSAR